MLKELFQRIRINVFGYPVEFANPVEQVAEKTDTETIKDKFSGKNRGEVMLLSPEYIDVLRRMGESDSDYKERQLRNAIAKEVARSYRANDTVSKQLVFNGRFFQ